MPGQNKNSVAGWLVIAAITFAALRSYIRHENAETYHSAEPAAETETDDRWNDLGEHRFLPDPSGPKVVVLQCEYQGRTYTIRDTFYRSWNDYFASLPRVIPYDKEAGQEDILADYYGRLVNDELQEETIRRMAGHIRELGRASGLSPDETAELALAFVQNIPYDERKAARILDRQFMPGPVVSYPYQTLYRQKGICSDKSLLAKVLLDELGYGTALFVFDSLEHMAVGIRCPEVYSSYRSGYCYAETTTAYNPIGIIPEEGLQGGKAVKATPDRILYFYNGRPSVNVPLEYPYVILETEGKSYRRISRTVARIRKLRRTKSRLSSLRSELNRLTGKINRLEQRIDRLNNELDKMQYSFWSNNKEYNRLVSEYHDCIEQHNSLVKTHERKRTEYNSLVNQYNSLLMELNLVARASRPGF